VTNWTNKVAAALRSQTVRQGIAQLAVAWMSEHIEEGRGRPQQGAFMADSPGPDGAPYRPLKALYGRRWVTGKPDGPVVKRRTRTVYGKKGKARKVTESLVEVPSYRNGGQPLRNTGKLLGSLNAKSATKSGGFRITMRGEGYGIYQDMGFSTSGPNFIPLTKAASRKADSKAARAAGMTRGSDYLRARKGVRVPARPFIMPTRNDLRALGKNIYTGLSAVLKGT